jgi:hypothetical protein
MKHQVQLALGFDDDATRWAMWDSEAATVVPSDDDVGIDASNFRQGNWS